MRTRVVVGASDQDAAAPAFLAPTKAAELQRVKMEEQVTPANANVK